MSHPHALAFGEQWLSLADAGKLLQLPAHGVKRLCKEGQLSIALHGPRGLPLFKRADVEHLAASRSQPGCAHSVRFYETQSGLACAVGAFVLSALRARAPALLIATRAHRALFEARLRQLGCDPERAERSGQLQWLDAEGALSSFMMGGRPDPEGFEALVSAALARLNARWPGRPRLYGEMVQLLTAAAQSDAALELERLWNRLAERREFSLLCAYALDSFAEARHSAAFDAICCAHGEVIPTESFPGGASQAQLRAIARLQQRATALQHELARNAQLTRLIRS
jgi:hypothetical protein